MNSDTNTNPHCGPLQAIKSCLPRLMVTSLALDTYGPEENAAVLHEIIGELQQALPSMDRLTGSGDDFLVKATYPVSRIQVADLLKRALCGGDSPYIITEYQSPERFTFHAIGHLTLRQLDYPLNDGGSLLFTRKGQNTDTRRLDLQSIAAGLEILATNYPRHFADFFIGNADSITADLFLQCCIYGEVICG